MLADLKIEDMIIWIHLHLTALCAAIIEKSEMEGWLRWMTARSPWRPRHQFNSTILIEYYLTLIAPPHTTNRPPRSPTQGPAQGREIPKYLQ